MGRYLIILSLVLTVLKAKGEDSPKPDSTQVINTKIFIEAGIGLGIPILNYGLPPYLPYNQDPSFQTGYASTGVQFNINAGYYFEHDLGVMIKISGNSNPFNTSVYKTRSYLANDTNVNVSGTSHYVGSYLGGLIIRLPRGVASLDGKLTMNAYALAGLMTLNGSTISENHSTGSSNTFLPPISHFGLNFGSGAVYSLTNNIGISLNINLLLGNFTFPSYTITGTGDIPASITYYTKTSMSIALFNPSIGIVLNL